MNTRSLLNLEFVWHYVAMCCWVYEQSPTLIRSGKNHGYIRMDKYLHWYEAFWDKAQKQIHEGLGPKWTISYHCGDMWCPESLHLLEDSGCCGSFLLWPLPWLATEDAIAPFPLSIFLELHTLFPLFGKFWARSHTSLCHPPSLHFPLFTLAIHIHEKTALIPNLIQVDSNPRFNQDLLLPRYG